MRVLGCVVLLLAACGESVPATTSVPASAPTIAPASSRPPAPPPSDCRPATPAERLAIGAAEAFVRDNGYTDAPVPEGVELASEGIEPGTDRAERIAFRHGTLEAGAYAVFPHEGDAQITVLFRYTREPMLRLFPSDPAEAERRLTETARAVVISDGAAPRVVHQDAMLQRAERVCPAAS